MYKIGIKGDVIFKFINNFNINNIFNFLFLNFFLYY